MDHQAVQSPGIDENFALFALVADDREHAGLPDPRFGNDRIGDLNAPVTAGEASATAPSIAHEIPRTRGRKQPRQMCRSSSAIGGCDDCERTMSSNTTRHRHASSNPSKPR